MAKDIHDINPWPSSNSRYFTNPITEWYLGHITTQNSTYLGMSESQMSTHELVQARIGASLVPLDPPFSIRLRELYARGAQ